MNGDTIRGYPRDLLKNKSDLTERITCGVCDLILRDVVQHECGHRFCSSCAEDLQSKPQPQFCPRCPPDSQEAPIRNIYPDFAGRKEVRLLRVRCVNSGCPFDGTLSDYLTHQDVCQHSRVPCPACDKHIKRVELQNHSLKDCTERTITCRWCNRHFIHRNMKQHNSMCPKLKILCEVCKKSKLPRDEMKLHQDPENGDCPLRKRCCKFRRVGCHFTAPQEQMPGHLKNNQQEHMHLLLEDNINIRTELECTKQKHKEYESMELVDWEKSRSTSGLHENSEKIGKRVGKNHNRMMKSPDMDSDSCGTGARKKCLNQSGFLKKENPEEIVQMVLQKLTHGNLLQSVIKEVSMLQIKSLENTSFNGILVWRIPNISNQRRDAISGKQTSIYSPYFFTSRYGYRVCCRIYLNGDGMGKGTHISIFFVIMKGANDALLPWPFRNKVSFFLLDQNIQEHISDGFLPDIKSSSFQRPTSDMNPAMGCPLFFLLSNLYSIPNSYIKDDTMFIKIIVDTTTKVKEQLKYSTQETPWI